MLPDFVKNVQECPKTDIQQNFNTEKFLGRWYEMYRTNKLPFQFGECNFAKYILRTDGRLRIINS